MMGDHRTTKLIQSGNVVVIVVKVVEDEKPAEHGVDKDRS